jgi:hypothetical protein
MKLFSQEKTPALQASDLLAWSESRYRASTEDRPFRQLGIEFMSLHTVLSVPTYAYSAYRPTVMKTLAGLGTPPISVTTDWSPVGTSGTVTLN